MSGQTNTGQTFTSDSILRVVKKMTMELWRFDYPLWYNYFEWIVLPWLPICQGKDSGLSPRYAPPWCMTMRGSDHAPPPSWTECLTALSNKLHSRQLAEISWKGELGQANGSSWSHGMFILCLGSLNTILHWERVTTLAMFCGIFPDRVR